MRGLWIWLAVAVMIVSASGDAIGEKDFSVTVHDKEDLSRRLLSLTSAFNSAKSMASKAEEWVKDETTKVAAVVSGALGIDKILQILKDGKKFVTEGLAMAQVGWTNMKMLVSRLVAIFTGFKPLQPVFADKNGLLTLLTNSKYLRILLTTIEDLLGTSDVMQMLSGALQKASAMFHSISAFFQSLLGKVTSSRRLLAAPNQEASEAWDAAERRLFDFTSLVSGLNFDSMQAKFQGFIPQVTAFSSTLTSLNATFGPLLQQVEGMLAGGRRLGMQQDQKKYAAAIKLVIPTWQGVEKLGIAMCPVVHGAHGSASSLSCRVQGFIDKAGLSSSIPTLVSGCTPTVETTCPTVSESAGIKNMLGENAEMLGWILAVGAGAFALIAGGGVGLLKMMGNSGGEGGDDDEYEDENEEQELVPAEES